MPVYLVIDMAMSILFDSIGKIDTYKKTNLTGSRLQDIFFLFLLSNDINRI